MDFIDIEALGAPRNSNASSYAALKHAIDMVNAKGGGTLSFPPGRGLVVRRGGGVFRFVGRVGQDRQGSSARSGTSLGSKRAGQACRQARVVMSRFVSEGRLGLVCRRGSAMSPETAWLGLSLA